MQGYVVTWVETRDGKRVKVRKDFNVWQHSGWVDFARDAAQAYAADLRALGYAACVEPIQ